MNTLRVNIIGSGNVAYWLSKGISGLGHDVTIITRRDASEVQHAFGLNAQNTLSADAEIVLICGPDDVIEEIAGSIPTGIIVAHTSGATNLEALSGHQNSGVLYPMQTLSINKEVVLNQLPLGLEFSNPMVESQLRELARFSENTMDLDSTQRLKFHLAAVFVNNFGNQMLEIAYALAEDGGLDPAILHPLMRETIEKAIAIGPSRAQTGPASRNDRNTIEKHLKLLDENPEYKEIYEVLTREIRRKHDHH